MVTGTSGGSNISIQIPVVETIASLKAIPSSGRVRVIDTRDTSSPEAESLILIRVPVEASIAEKGASRASGGPVLTVTCTFGVSGVTVTLGPGSALAKAQVW